MDIQQNECAKPERLLRRSEAARYVVENYGIPCAAKTLAKLACVSSKGPPFRLVGRFPLYPTSGLDSWAQAKIGPLIHSTSEALPRFRPTRKPDGERRWPE
jgi:hypothetical protein